jgi:hypothetical protein
VIFGLRPAPARAPPRPGRNGSNGAARSLAERWPRTAFEPPSWTASALVRPTGDRRFAAIAFDCAYIQPDFPSCKNWSDVRTTEERRLCAAAQAAAKHDSERPYAGFLLGLSPGLTSAASTDRRPGSRPAAAIATSCCAQSPKEGLT